MVSRTDDQIHEFLVIFLDYINRTLVAAAKTMEAGNIVYGTIAGAAISKFCMMLFVSALIGVAFGLLSALVCKDKFH